MDCLIWNVRGLNNKVKQLDIANFLQNHRTPFVALLENKLVASEVELVKKRILGRCTADYSHFHDGRGRIWILWLTKSANITIHSSSEQYVHSEVTLIESGLSFYVTIVYGSNSPADRQILWADLLRKAPHISIPWLVGGDFNEVRYTNEKLGGRALQTNRLMNFNSCIGQCNLFDLHATGNTLSWNNRQDNRIACRLDRLMANSEWFNLFPEAYTQYLPGSLSDHASMKLIVAPPLQRHPKPFKFFNAWLRHGTFMDVLKQAWSIHIQGTAMYKLAKKLQHAKQVLKAWNIQHFGKAQDQVECKRDQLSLPKLLCKGPLWTGWPLPMKGRLGSNTQKL
ncbi:hypothetical protein QJS10_CPA08g00722 [Acorus calamus]|uniref:Endonuclease/exonuclease/phosphatase domain-containing protein n=1 Tax=Acorus calamus TaxID=4465 RepID=A0AAV9ECD0_ACOCL|nr:hypothetical protein QJS10_CPA08g00722 [Acorus calamus]